MSEVITKKIKVFELFSEKKEDLNLELVSDSGLTEREVSVPDINRPGLALAGYTEIFLSERIQIMGRTEIGYLATLEEKKRKEAIERVMKFQPPVFIFTHENEAVKDFIPYSKEYKVPILKTNLPTTYFIHRLTSYLDYKLAPETYVHGDLVDVYGIGLLIIGESGIGKSECALDLVARGHRLVADDLVKILRRGEGILMGYSAAKSPKLQHHIEIRGVGIVDIYSLFGVRAIRVQKRIEVVVELVKYKKDSDYERLGLEDQYTEILNVKIPLVRIPVIPGKNLALVCEVIAKNHLSKILGYHPAKTFYEELNRILLGKPQVDQFITDDIE
ncbi:MAG: HPr(Ser) kinase/phosphatase [candidate division WOR-3 bacterium]|nr:HPr(Ser) kinase/phosphatase [candidate division WOR-3 bacterium]MCX7837323.1 HPr(Ser) kinase/phosphatase [candidate division WOR-3 bacterium]MDW8114614.1 HPr(Ser) kinase/phosphatase [candidate division WOR-3 bacterium]